MNNKLIYVDGILEAHRYLLDNYEEFFVFGQGLWSPWYVGSSMKDLDKDYGTERIIDSPVSEVAVTGAAVGASLCGYRPLVVHPRVDFMILAIDQIVSQAAKWSSMFGGQANPSVTFRGIVNRGGEQGAQHSQALHSWFSHIPGLRVVMPYTAKDARDLLVASVLSDDPVLFIDDRWLYEVEEDYTPVTELNLANEKPKVIKEGTDLTFVGAGHGTLLAKQAAEKLELEGISAEVVDLRIVNPIDYSAIVNSVKKTGNLCVVDSAWTNCGLAGEIMAGVLERVDLSDLKSSPIRVTLVDSPAPTSKLLEQNHYIKVSEIIDSVKSKLKIHDKETIRS